MRSVLIFIHIPRTGGTSFRMLLERLFQPEEILSVYGSDILRARSVVSTYRGLPTIKVVRGHIAFGVHEVIGDRPYQYVTIVRHPLRRVVSLYNYIRRDRSHGMHADVIGMDLAEFVRSGLSLETDNGQVRQLCGSEGEFPQESYGSMVTPHGKIGRDKLEEAMFNLHEQRALVGITSQLSNFSLLITDWLGVAPVRYPHVNRAPGVHAREVDDKTANVIMEYNQLDLELWRIAHLCWGVT